MTGPRFLLDGFATLVLVTSVYCFSRLLAARRWHRSLHYDVNLAHVAMGIAMAGMFVGRFRTLPGTAWVVIFGGLTAWFALQIARFVRRHGLSGWDADDGHHVSHYATHLVMALAMLYMLVAADVPSALASGGSSPGSSGMVMAAGRAGTMNAARSGLPVLFLVVLLVSAVWHADGLARFSERAVRRPVGSEPRAGGKNGSLGAIVAGSAPAGAPSPAAFPAAHLGNARRYVGTAVRDRGGRAALSVWRRRPTGGPVVLSCRDRRWLAPRLEITCHIAMCIAMGYMLVSLR